jgi:HK97 family phage portal protein
LNPTVWLSPFTRNKVSPEYVFGSGSDDLLTKASKNTPEIAKLYTNGQRKDANSSYEDTFATSDLIYSCIDYIAKTAAQADLKIGEVGADGKIGDVKDKKAKEMFENAPNNGYSWYDLKELIVQSFLVSGNAYVSFEKLSKGYEMWVMLPPSKMEVVPSETNYVEGYLYDKKVSYSADEIIHIKNTNLGNEYYGKSAIERLVDYLLVEGYGVEDLKTFYENASIGQGILTSPNPMNKEQLETLREEFKKNYASQSNRHSTYVLANGMEYKTVKMSPKDSMLLDSFNITEHRVLQMFHLNPLVLGGKLESYTTHTQEVQKMVFNGAVRPILRKIEAVFSQFFRRVLKNPKIKVYFDFDNIPELDESINTKADVAKTLLTNGIISVNEAREMLGFHKLDVENAELHWLPSFIVGADAQTIETWDGTATSATNQQPAPVGSTDPQGGKPNGTTRS